MATRLLGWVVFVACLVLAVGYAVLFVLVSVIAVGIDPFANLASMAALVVPPLVLYGFGRDLLYLLVGK